MNPVLDIRMPLFQPNKLTELSIQKIRRTLERGFTDEWRSKEYFIHLLIYFLHCDGNEALQVEASWIFTNIAAGSYEQTKWIVDRGIVPPTMRLLSSPSDEVIEQAIWTLGNVIGDHMEFRDLLIDLGIIPRLIAMDIDSKSISFRRTFTWVFVNLVRCKDPQISIDRAKSIIPTINSLVMAADTIVKVDALWALTYIADCGDNYIQIVIDSGIVSTIVPLLSSHRFKIQLAAMRMLGNIATGTDAQTTVLLVNDILVHIRFPLMHPKDCLRRMALWCLSNITAGTPEQVQSVFSAGLLNRIVENLAREDMKTKREALITIFHMINAGTGQQMLQIIELGTVNSLFQLLLTVDESIASTAHNALKILFSKADKLVEKYSQVYARLMRPQPPSS